MSIKLLCNSNSGECIKFYVQTSAAIQLFTSSGIHNLRKYIIRH